MREKPLAPAYQWGKSPQHQPINEGKALSTSLSMREKPSAPAYQWGKSPQRQSTPRASHSTRACRQAALLHHINTKASQKEFKRDSQLPWQNIQSRPQPHHQHAIYAQSRPQPHHQHAIYAQSRPQPHHQHAIYAQSRTQPHHQHAIYAQSRPQPHHQHAVYARTQHATLPQQWKNVCCSLFHCGYGKESNLVFYTQSAGTVILGWMKKKERRKNDYDMIIQEKET